MTSAARCTRIAHLTLALTALAGCRSREEPAPSPATPSGKEGAVKATTAPAKLVRTRPDHVEPGMTCATAGCHADLKERRHVHGPIAVGNCDACHGAEQ